MLSGMCCNTNGYMGPQVLRGGHYPDISDNYSLGVAFYQLFMGYLPGEVDMQEINLFPVMKHDDYALYERDWL